MASQLPERSRRRPGRSAGHRVWLHPAHCIVDGPIGINGNEAGDVVCFDTSGNLLDTLYTTQWMVG